jgi:Uma2 family endonuclease
MYIPNRGRADHDTVATALYAGGAIERRHKMDEEAGASVLSRCPELPRHLWTVEEYHRMGESGLLDDARVELIEGEIIEMVPIGDAHAAVSNRLNRLLVLAVGDRGIVAVGNPVRLSPRTEPQPDFSVLRPRADYQTRGPRPEDVMLAVEVSDTTLRQDRRVKLALYARAGIPEFWIVNLEVGEIEVYRSPTGDTYASVERKGVSEVATIAALAGVTISIGEILR